MIVKTIDERSCIISRDKKRVRYAAASNEPFTTPQSGMKSIGKWRARAESPRNIMRNTEIPRRLINCARDNDSRWMRFIAKTSLLLSLSRFIFFVFFCSLRFFFNQGKRRSFGCTDGRNKIINRARIAQQRG